jgi:serine/threonine protein kinase/WD40 repeat protein
MTTVVTRAAVELRIPRRYDECRPDNPDETLIAEIEKGASSEVAAMKRNFFLVLLEKEIPPRAFVGNSLRVLEYRVRELALIGLADWQQAEIPAALCLEHVPELIPAVGKLQRPAWGHWSGLLRQLEVSRKRIEKRAEPAVAEKLGEAAYLKAVLKWLATRTPTPLVRQLDPLARLLGTDCGKKLTWHTALELAITLRNQIVHYGPSEAAWWAKAAEGLRPLIEALAVDHDTRQIPEPIPLPRPWFIPGGSSILSFGGMRDDFTPVYLGLNVEPCPTPGLAQEIMVAFRQLLGAADADEPNLRRLMTRLLPEEQKGVQLGEYLVGKPVGEGGFARVHVGWQMSTGRKTAIKILHDGLPRECRLRFQDEAAFLGELDHPGIVGVLGHGIATWIPREYTDLSREEWFQDFRRTTVKEFIALEFVEGRSIEQMLREPAGIPSDVAALVVWFTQAAEALAEVHSHDLIHRDVKPSNLIVTPEGRVKLLDFGIARSQVEAQTIYTHLGKEAATPVYAAPEQLRKDRADRVGPRSDIYGLCATFYELFCRSRLYDYDRIGVEQATSRKLGGEPLIRPRSMNRQVPWEIEVLLLGGLQSDIDLRPKSARDLADDLDRVRENRPIAFRRPSWARRGALSARRHKRPLQVFAATTLVALVASGVIAARLTTAVKEASVLKTAVKEAEERVGGLTMDLDASKRLAQEKGQSAKENAKRAALADKQKRVEEYLGDMQRLPNLWKADAIGEVRRILHEHEPANGHEDLRGFEWWHWDALSDASVRNWSAGTRVVSLDWSPDGRFLYTVGAAGTIRGAGRLDAWDIESGRRTRLGAANGQYLTVAADPTGQRIAVIKGGVAYMVDWIDPKGRTPPRTIPKPFASVAVSSDGQSFVASKAAFVASEAARELAVYDAQTGTVRVDLTASRATRFGLPEPDFPPQSHIRALAYSRDGSMVASGAEDGSIALWDPKSGRYLGRLKTDSVGRGAAHRGAVSSVAFSRDGTKLLSRGLPSVRDNYGSSSAPGELILWDIRQQALLWRIEFPLGEVASTPRATLRIWSQERHMFVSIPGMEVHNGGNDRADFVLDDRRVAVGKGPVVQLYDADTKAPAGELKGHSSPVVCLRAAPDGVTLATSDEAGEIRVWNVAATVTDDALVARLDAPVLGLAAAPRADRIAAVVGPATALVYDRHRGLGDRAGAERGSPSLKSDSRGPADWVARQLGEVAGDYRGLSFSPSGRLLAALGPFKTEGSGRAHRAIHTVRVWDAQSGRVVRDFEDLEQALGSRNADESGPPRSISPLWAAFCNEDEVDVGAIGTSNFRVTAWWLRLRLDTKRVELSHAWSAGEARLSDPRGPLVSALVSRVAFSVDGRRAAAGKGDGGILIYNAEPWKQETSLHQHSGGVMGLAFSTDGRRLVSCSRRTPDERPGEIIIWDTETWKPCLTLTRGVPSEYSGVGLSPDGRTLYAAANLVEPGTRRQPRGFIVRWGRASGLPEIPVEGAASSPGALAQ